LWGIWEGNVQVTGKPHDSEYFRLRAAEARATASTKGRHEEGAVSGELALAYAALARRRAAADAEIEVRPAVTAEPV
jgi:hypothetical protein